MAKKATRSRPSKASVLRAIKEAEEELRTVRTLPPTVSAIIDGYTSTTVPTEQLPRVRQFLREVIVASPLVGEESVRKHCRHVGALANYALTRGLDLAPRTVMRTDLVDEYIRLGMPGASDTLRAERRRRLLALASHVNPGPTAPAKLAPIGHNAIKPCYTPAELTLIKRAALEQPTPARVRDLSAVVGLGAGAGLDSVDLRDLHLRDISRLDNGCLLVHVHGPRPRIVPVRRHCEQLVLTASAGRTPDALVLGHKKDRRNTAARAVEGAALIDVPHIEPARLRATWLADVMTDNIPIGLILQAAGLRSARTLAELLPHLDPWLKHKDLAAEGVGALRGGAR